MPELMKSNTVSVPIALPPQRVYDFAVEPENLPRWAPAFCKSITYEQGKWVIRTPDGPATVRFAARNPFGVLHAVPVARHDRRAVCRRRTASCERPAQPEARARKRLGKRFRRLFRVIS